MSRLIEQLRTLCGNCIIAPQNRNADRLKPCCGKCELRWKAADELDRLQAIVDRLPKDGEGNTIFDGDDLYFSIDGVTYHRKAVMCTEGDDDSYGIATIIGWDRWHKSKDAAEKARTP